MASMEQASREAGKATSVQRLPFTVVTSVFLGLTLAMTALRMYLQLGRSRALHAADAAVLVSALCLIGATITVQLGLTDTYLATAVSADPLLLSTLPTSAISDLAKSFLKYREASNCLLWTAIFGAKLACMMRFKHVVHVMALACTRARKCWYAALVAILLGWAFMLCIPLIACPRRGAGAVNRCLGSDRRERFRILTLVGTAVDSITYLLVLPFPFLTLHRHACQPPTLRQKAALATLAILFAAAITTAILRSARPHDSPLQAFLTSVECCVAIIAALTTSLRGLFEASQFPSQRSQPHRWLPRALARQLSPSSNTSSEKLPFHNPDTMLSSLQTFVAGTTKNASSQILAPPPKPPAAALTQAPSPPPSLARNESVLRTREVVIEVSYENDVERGDWDRLVSPSWIAEEWKRSGSSMQ